MRTLLSLFALFSLGSAVANEQIPELEIEIIQKDVYLHQSYSRVDGFGLVSSNGLVVIGDGKAFIVDTPWSTRDTKKLAQWIKEQNLQLTGSISTHSHEDRAAGIEWLNAHSVPTYASSLTNKLLKKEGKELASNTFEGTDAVLADGLIEAFYPGGGHTIDNIVVWLPKSNILFGGCFVRSSGSKGLGYTGEAHINEWPHSIDNVSQKFPDIRVVVPGHGKIGDSLLLEHTRELAVTASNEAVQIDE